MSDPRNTLAHTLRDSTETISGLNVLAGFDGFVDELIEIVEERHATDTHTRVPTISRFAELIGMAAGRSSLREMIVKSIDAGGCAVNLGDGIASLGVQLDVFGTMGDPPNPAFADFAKKCRSCNSFGIDPGHTLALEFEDGKYMLSAMNQLADFTPDFLEAYLKDSTLKQTAKKADLIAITNWTLYPHMTDCWSYLLEHVFSACKNPWFFIDLVDPRSRSHQDIREMMKVLPGYEACGRCCFGGNLNEGNVLSELLDLPQVHTEGPEVAELCSRLRDALGLTEVVIHCIKGAAVAAEDGAEWVDGPYTPNPLKSTGAGDRFNAGYCLARLLNLSPQDRLLLGNATSGFFVRNARSGSLAEIAYFLEEWANGGLE